MRDMNGLIKWKEEMYGARRIAPGAWRIVASQQFVIREKTPSFQEKSRPRAEAGYTLLGRGMLY
jgi:hypothetical protein